MKLICPIIVILIHVQLSLSQLKQCQQDVGVSQIGYNVTCYSDRIQNAIKRHHVFILDFGFSPKTVFLDCPVCPKEDPSDFEWKFISRLAPGEIFIQTSDTYFDSNYTLKPDILGEVPISEEKLQCLVNNSNDLYLSEINADKFMGTYVCRHKINKTHPANFIWYHLDVIEQSSGQTITSANVPDMSKVESKDQLIQLQQLAKQDLMDYQGWTDQVNGPFVMTTRYVADDIYIGQCGLLKVSQERQCYVRIPSTEPKGFDHLEHMYAYRVLRSAFDFLVSAPGWTIPSGRRIRQWMRERIRQNKFDFQGNGDYLYVPCGYSLFRHLYKITDGLSGFPGPSIRLEVTYDIACVRVGNNELLDFFRESDFSLINMTIPSLVDYRYNKIQRLVIEGEKGLVLRCPTHRQLNCSKQHAEAIWRSGNDLTFDRRKKGENVYMTDSCDLYFEQVHRFDVDIYYCYLRERNELTAVWSKTPRIAYRLQMEESKLQWPRENDLLVGVVILIMWAVCLSIMWVMLSLYDSVTRDHALFEATVKQAGGRMARLKQVYSPFSDEDKALFFKVLQDE